MGEKVPPAMEKSTPPIRSEEKNQLIAEKKKKKDTIRMKRKKDNSAERESGKKRKKKVKNEEKKKKENKRPRDKDSIKAEEAGSEQKRIRQEDEIPLPVAVSMCQIHAELGSGSFGKVLLASLPSSQHVAIKVIQKSDEYQLADLITEARVLKVAAGCPHLCHAYGSFQTQRRAFVVMEYVSGGTMENQMYNGGRMEMDSITFYAAEMVCALQFLHCNGIIHRDVKPANVLVTSEGHVKVCDFGLAVEGIFENVKARGNAGTVRYMAPEVILEEQYDAGIDWWSLGIILYEMATKCYPFNESSDEFECMEAILCEDPYIPEWLSEDLQNLLQQLLEKDPEKRLGCNGNIREHPFFHSIDWVQLEKQNVPPPSVPMPSVDFDETYEKPLSFLQSIKHTISSRNDILESQLEQPIHFAIQPYPAYWPNFSHYQHPLPSVPVSSLYHHLSPVICPPPVPALFPSSHHHHDLPFNFY